MAEPGQKGWRGRIARLRGLRALRRFRASDAGSAAVEFAFVGVPFFMVLFAILETGLFLWAGQVLDSATANSARLILTGQVQAQGMTRDQFKANLCSRIVGLIDCVGGVLIDVKVYASWAAVDIGRPVDTTGHVTATGQTFEAGTAGSIVVVRSVYPYPILFRTFGLDMSDLADGKRLLVSTVAFQNEPFPVVSSAQ